MVVSPRPARSTALKIDGKKVTRVGEVTVGRFPEGAVFSPDGEYVYVGNFIDREISVLKVEGDKVTDTGRSGSNCPASPPRCAAAHNRRRLSQPQRSSQQTGAGGGIEACVGVDAVSVVEVGDVARLAEALDPERHNGIAERRRRATTASPGENRRP